MTADHARVLTVPNVLSVVRLVMVPWFAVVLLDGREGFALVLFVVAGVTDAIDGYVARRFAQQTTLGTFLDPLADKLLSMTAYVLLAHLGILPIWLAALVVLRDVLLLASPLVMLALHRQQLVVRVSWLGKANTTLQIVTVAAALAVEWSGVPPWTDLPMAVLVAVTGASIFVSGFHYLWRDRALLRSGEDAAGTPDPPDAAPMA